jgi:mono/diheme cytochrome c family protein
MKTKLLVSLTLLVFVLAACGGAPTETVPEPVAPTQAESQPAAAPTSTPVPPTEAAAPTETSEPATEVPAASGISFANDVMPIFQNSCVGCHGGDQTRAGLDLKTYDSLMSGSINGAVIAPGSVAESLLVELVAEGKMPKRGDKLTPEQVKLISEWVAAGALNN